jgi:hypothetical protein
MSVINLNNNVTRTIAAMSRTTLKLRASSADRPVLVEHRPRRRARKMADDAVGPISERHFFTSPLLGLELV